MSTWSVSVNGPPPTGLRVFVSGPSFRETRECPKTNCSASPDRPVSPTRFRRRLGAPNTRALGRLLLPVVLTLAPAMVNAQAVPAIAYEKYTLPNGLEVI